MSTTEDLTFTWSGELMVTQIQGNTEDGIEFVDRWIQEEFTVVDAGQIIVPGRGEAIEKEARFEGLSIEHDLIASEKPTVL
jgi:hypothetical protein